NESTSSAAGTCTIRLINDATNNDIKYCNIKGSSLSTGDGIVTFSTTTGTSGNDDNSVEHNHITNNDNNRPVNAIFSLGTETKENSGNTINNNQIFDFLNAANTSHGIELSGYNTGWTISGNSFFETTAFAPSANVAYVIINISNAGTGYEIDGNFVGGSAAECSGTWTKTSGANSFVCMMLSINETSTTNSITNNTIKGFDFDNSGNPSWSGIIYDCTNSVNGVISGNTIGSSTGTGAIAIRNSGTASGGAQFTAITSLGDADVEDNVIGSITLDADENYFFNFFGIMTSMGTECSISNNIIGSEITANSIISTSVSDVAGSANPGHYQFMRGIYTPHTTDNGILTISGNTIANLTNNIRYEYDGISVVPLYGISSGGAEMNINNNKIHDLKVDYFGSDPSVSLAYGGAIVGISLYANAELSEISRNEIYNIEVANSTNGTEPTASCGIHLAVSSGSTAIYGNFIHSIDINTSSSGSFISGMHNYYSEVSYYNNVISLGNSVNSHAALYGILEWHTGAGGDEKETFFNTIYIGGTAPADAGKSYAFFSLLVKPRSHKNNIFCNTRTGGTGTTHYAIGLSTNVGLSIDYNDYYVSGANSLLGFFDGSDIATLADWQAATGGDANSLTVNPDFANPGGTDPEDYKTGVLAEGNTIAGLTEDYAGTARYDPPTMGAFEYEPKIIFVKHNASGANNGNSWANAYISLQAGLEAAYRGDKIYVASGTYHPSKEPDGTTDEPRRFIFTMKNGVGIYGGFAGNEDPLTFNLNERDFLTNETILSGDLSDNDIFDINYEGGYCNSTGEDNCYHVIYYPDLTPALDNTATLDGFTITGGNAFDSVNSDLSGGGLYIHTASPVISNVIIKNNAVGCGGGGVAVTEGNPVFINSLIYSNYAAMGGGIDNYGAAISLTNTTVTGNVAWSIGGGIKNDNNGITSLNNCVVWNNIAGDGQEIKINSGIVSLNFSCYDNQEWDISGTISVLNSITTDPRFVDPANDDFTLYGSSPCVNTGNNAYVEAPNLVVEKDFRGENRIQNSTIDMGCYEWTSGTDPDGIIIFVDINASGSNNGKSWTNAFNSFQSALDIANNGDQIWVAAGVYKPSQEPDGTTDEPRKFTFQMKNGVEILGGFEGTEDPATFDLDDRDFAADETILSGDLSGDDLVTGIGETLAFSNNGENCYHVFYHPNTLALTSSAVLDGFTISGGNANSGWPYGQGGGMLNDQCTPMINNVLFKHNSGVSGGGLYVYTSNGAFISNLTFEKNGGGDGCGGLTVFESSITLTNALFVYNKGRNGGVVNKNSTSEITNVTFYGNYAWENGGGIINEDNGTLTLNNCIVWNNIADEDGDEIYHDGNSITLNNCCYKNDAGDVFGSVSPTNCINSDPRLSAPESDDFRLTHLSPCLDTGSDGYNDELYDIRGKGFGRKLLKTDHTQTGTIDMGAYEYKEGTDPLSCTNPTDGGVIAAAQTLCSGHVPDPFTSVSAPTGYVGDLEYQWQISTSSPTFVDIPGAASETYTHTGTVTQTTWFRRLARVTCDPGGWASATASDIVRVDIDPLPVAGAGGSATICENGSHQVSGASAANGTILWTHNGEGSLIDETTLTPTYTAASGDGGNTVTLTMTVTSDNSCGTATTSANYTVYVEPLPQAAAGGSATICESGSHQVSGASAANGTVAWSHNGTGNLTGTSTLAPTYTAAAGDAGNDVLLTLTVTSANICSPVTATATYTITVDPLPTASAGGSAVICSSEESYTLQTGEASASNGTILWTHNGKGSLQNETTLTPTYSIANLITGVYTNYANWASQATKGGKQITTENFSAYNAGYLVSPHTFTTGSYNYTVSTAGGLYITSAYGRELSTDAALDAITITFSPGVTCVGGNFYSSNIAGNYVNNEVIINFNGDDPPASITSSPADVNNFVGYVSSTSITSITISSVQGGGALVWPTLDNLRLSNAAGEVDGTVTLTITVNSNNFCQPVAASATYTITYDPLPTASAGGSATICETGSHQVSGASATHGTIHWTHNGAGNLVGTSTLTPTYTAAAGDAGNAVVLTLTVTSNNTCGAASAHATYTINVDPLTIGGTAINTQTICSSEIPDDLELVDHVGNVLRWQRSSDVDFTSPQDIAETSATLAGTTIGAVTQTTWFRAEVQSGVCAPAFSDPVVVNIDLLPPSAIPKNNAVYLDPMGSYTLAADDVLSDYNDDFTAKQDITVTMNPGTFSCSEAGQTFQVIINLEDECGNSSTVYSDITVHEGTALLPPWLNANTHASANGTASYSPCDDEGTFMLTATGKSTTTSDVFHSVHQELCGNGTVIARLDEVQNGGWGGVMMRENTTPGAKTILFKTRLYNPNVIIGYRTTTNKSMRNLSQVAQLIR
ncbi:MAG: hypothetical protein IH598_04530, partial [Bacteroidales bacterium]|nr:hypothetical protein [Bacteroidales bacterium]